MTRSFQRAVTGEPIAAVVMIALAALLAYGLSIPRLGFYHDDWYMLWSGAARGADSLVPLFRMDRPFMGVIYAYFYRALGESIPGWHLFALLMRVAGGAAFYWILTLAFPGRRGLFVPAAMLFVIFPGFLAQGNAATKINHLTGYAAALFSIALTLAAARARNTGAKAGLTALALLSMALYLWIYEYMIGLEATRLALLFWLEWRGRRENVLRALRRTLLAYIPYALVIGLFLYWRVFVFESTRDATDLRGLVTEYQENFWVMALRLTAQVLKDFFAVMVFSWFVQPYLLLTRAAPADLAAAFLVAGAGVLLAAVYRALARPDPGAEEESPPPGVLVGLGALSALAAVFPVVASNRSLDLLNQYKGYGLHPSQGVIIALLGLAAMLRPRFRYPALLALLALSFAAQFLNAQYWARYWEAQRTFWWQLTWRAPDIHNDTLVMAYLPEGYVFQQDYEVWGPLNLIYRPLPENFPPIQSEVLNPGTLADLREGRVTDPHVRDIFLPRDYRKALVLSQPTAASCLHAIDGAFPVYSSSERAIVELAGPYSKIGRINPRGSPPAPPAAIFGKEPERGWCYLYQQAELARQLRDWARVGALYDQAVAEGRAAGDASEYFVFVEGLANAGRAEEARALAEREIQPNAALHHNLCAALQEGEVRDLVCR